MLRLLKAEIGMPTLALCVGLLWMHTLPTLTLAARTRPATTTISAMRRHAPTPHVARRRHLSLRRHALAHTCPSYRGLLPPGGPCGDRSMVAYQGNPNGSLAAPPSISEAAIWHAFWAAGSPLADNGPRRDGLTYSEYIWRAGFASGIDPAIALGIFWAESQYGRAGEATVTHSLGNIRCSGGYCGYTSWFEGIDDIYRQLSVYAYKWNLTTLDTAIPVWAPVGDGNDPDHYIAVVRTTMDNLAAIS